jgi:hypothetical protein
MPPDASPHRFTAFMLAPLDVDNTAFSAVCTKLVILTQAFWRR